MTNDDHAALIEVKGRLIELRPQREAEEASDCDQLHDVRFK